MGLIKWVQRRIEAASDNRKCSDNQTVQISSIIREDDIRLPTRAIRSKETKGKRNVSCRVRAKSAAGDNHVNFVRSSNTLLDDIRLPTRAIPMKESKGKRMLFRRERAKSAADNNNVNCVHSSSTLLDDIRLPTRAAPIKKSKGNRSAADDNRVDVIPSKIIHLDDIRLPTRALPAQKEKGRKLFHRVCARSAADINHLNFVPSSNTRLDDILLPTRALSVRKGKGQRLHEVRAKSAADINNLNFAPCSNSRLDDIRLPTRALSAKKGQEKLLRGLCTRSVADVNHLNFVPSSNTRLDDIRLPTRVNSTKKEGMLIRSAHTKSAANIHCANFISSHLPRQKSCLPPVHPDITFISAMEHVYEELPEVHYECIATFTPPRCPTTTTSKPTLHPRSMHTRPQLHNNQLRIRNTRKYGCTNTKMINSQSSPAISDATRVVKAREYDRNITSVNKTQYTALQNKQIMSRDITESRFRNSKSARDLYDDPETSFEECSYNLHQEPIRFEYDDLEFGYESKIGENLHEISAYDFDTSGCSIDVLPRTPMSKNECDATSFDILPHRDVILRANFRAAVFRNQSAFDHNTSVRNVAGLPRTQGWTALPHTPGWMMKYNGNLIDVLPCEEIDEHYISNNNLSEGNSRDTEDEMSLSMIGEKIKMFQNQLRQRKQRAMENRRRRSCPYQPLQPRFE